jgi:hypothetical protein
MGDLGRLEQVDIREVWAHEARDFSSWLAKQENLSVLGDQLGIDIEPLGTEVDVGRFRIDILAKEPNTDERIIIENQLEPTNHDHLGKVITYAAGLDAHYLIWIVKDVLPEHLKAVEWLNDHLDESVRCFLIKIEVWKIGESKPAPRFDVISVKNDWAATVKRSVASTEVSELKLRQQAFWQRFVAYCRNKDSSLKLQTPRPQHWLDFSMGTSICHIALTINTKQEKFSAQIYIPNDKLLWEYLKENELDINADLGSDFVWWEGTKAAGGGLDNFVKDVFDESSQESYFDWLYNSLISLKKTFLPLVQDYKKQVS